MKALIVYLAVTGGPRTAEFAERFVTTFRAFPPEHSGDLLVVSNGGPLPWEVGALFAGLEPKFMPRANVGGDIGAYLDVARRTDCDALLALGESTFFHRSGWLRRLSEVWTKHGPGLYGFFASNLVTKHLNTTAFCTTPKLLCAWPEVVRTKEDRYNFEHGPRPFWRHVESLKMPVRLVMWDHDQAPWEWRQGKVENEFWRGSQNQVLMKCSHTERFDNATKATKTRWTNNCDKGLGLK